MNSLVIEEITRSQIQADRAAFKVGDGVRVHTKIREGDKERVQIFAGIVISRRGRGVHESFTVRRISYGEGVERIFPVHSPSIARIEVDREAITQKARLFYLRKRIGKQATTVKERRLLEAAGAIDATSAPEAEREALAAAKAEEKKPEAKAAEKAPKKEKPAKAKAAAKA